jgi:hypothetical protein
VCVVRQKLELVQPMMNVADLDTAAVKAKLLQLRPRNSTDMVLGMRGGAQLLTDFARPPASLGPKNASSSSSWSIGNLVSSIFKSKSGGVQASAPTSAPAIAPAAATPTPAIGVSKRIMFLTDAEVCDRDLLA